VSVHWPIIKRLAANPLRVAVVDDVRSYRGIELLIAAMHVADTIDACCSTQTVGMMLPTSGAAPICLLAGWMTGKTIVPLNFLLEARANSSTSSTIPGSTRSSPPSRCSTSWASRRASRTW
jgi:acyl-CoA synthetase (AMP-forming)/AMP-acid ligase II